MSTLPFGRAIRSGGASRRELGYVDPDEPLLRVWALGLRRDATRDRLGVIAALLLHGGIFGWVASRTPSARAEAPTASMLEEIAIATESEPVLSGKGSAISVDRGATSGGARHLETQPSRPANDLLKRLVEMYGSEITEPASMTPTVIDDENALGKASHEGPEPGDGAGSGTGTGTGSGIGTGTGTGTGTSGATPRSRPNLSRNAALGSDSVWDCDSPTATLVDRVVRLVVMVRPDGTAAGVDVVSDPGSGFGKAARDCAFKHRFTPARDPNGQPVLGPTASFGVRFRH